MQTVTVQLKMATPMEEALQIAAWEDDRSVGDIVRDAVAREIRRRRAAMERRGGDV